MTKIIWYAPPVPVAELRALRAVDPSPRFFDGQHRSHVMDLARWFADIEKRTGRTVETLLASEQREYDRRVAEIRAVEAMRTPKLSPTEALLRLETDD